MRATRHSRFRMYASVSNDVRSGICIGALARACQSRRDDEIYAESNAMMSPAIMTLRGSTPDKIGLQIMRLMRSSA